jgi:hypothetical protein
MLESVDVDERRLTTKPVKVSDAGSNNVGTVWMLREGEVVAWCRSYCRRIKGGTAHTPDHVENG